MERRYDIDWIRVIAIGLLMVYHVAIVFQPWGLMIGFMTNTPSWESLWIPMTMLNVWRIPILFFISGIGVAFSFQNRNWKELLQERGMRIGIPYAVGFVLIAPIYLLILQSYYDWKVDYVPHVSHLWFLGNILGYVLLTIIPLHLLKKSNDSRTAINIRKVVGSYAIFPIVIVCFVLEYLIVNPPLYEMYAQTTHGFFLGWLAFIFGNLFVYERDRFWRNTVKLRWIFLALSILLFIARNTNESLFPLKINMPIETCLWVFAIFGFAKRYLNFSNSTLRYLSKAAYPIYILHMIFIGLSCMVVLPLSLSAQIKFFLILFGTILGSLAFYELFIRRIKYVGILFGVGNFKNRLNSSHEDK